jgi:hypothetical protein
MKGTNYEASYYVSFSSNDEHFHSPHALPNRHFYPHSKANPITRNGIFEKIISNASEI